MWPLMQAIKILVSPMPSALTSTTAQSTDDILHKLSVVVKFCGKPQSRTCSREQSISHIICACVYKTRKIDRMFAYVTLSHAH